MKEEEDIPGPTCHFGLKKTTSLKKKEKEALSWEPVHKGEIYCSPACGHGCKKEEYRDALELAHALVRKLGKGWKPRVWENIGWHYEARTLDEKMSVSPLVSVPGFHSFLGSGGPGGRWVGHGGTPQEAVAEALAKAKAEAHEILEIIASYERTTC
jgi:hypothetical protein